MTEHWVYGLHAATALLENPLRKIKQLCISESREDSRMTKLLDIARNRSIPVETLSAQKMNLRFPGIVHQGVAVWAQPLPQYHENDIPHLLSSARQAPLVLILDGITDPHNLGACFRTADAAGVDFIIIPKDKSAGITAVVSKVACGAAESVPLVSVTNLARAMDVLKQAGVWIYGAAGEAVDSVYSVDFKGAAGIVLGAEGQGMRRLTRERCDGLFSLPMSGIVSSLNVSVAAGVILYESVRQRRL